MGWEGLEIAHNGVRGDNVVEVREAREQPNHQSDEEDDNDVSTQSYRNRDRNVCDGLAAWQQCVFGQTSAPSTTERVAALEHKN